MNKLVTSPIFPYSSFIMTNTLAVVTVQVTSPLYALIIVPNALITLGTLVKRLLSASAPIK